MSKKVARDPGLPASVARQDVWESAALESGDFPSYQRAIMHDWLGTLTLLASVLIPLFFVLDTFMMPADLLPRFAIYRGISTLITIAQRLIVRRTRPGRWSYLHGYLLSLHVGGVIALMTVDLGGFGSSYYAGLILVIIGVTLLMPWREIHTLLNSLMIILMYVALNLTLTASIAPAAVLNNIFFLGATATLSIGITWVRFRLMRKEFTLLIDLGKARDALQGEKNIVEDRTRSLKSLLDVSGQGFLSFGPDFLVSPEYSRECGNIFGRDVGGVPIDGLLYHDEESKANFRKGLSLFFDGKIRPEVIFEHLDRVFGIRDKTVNASYKEVSASRVMVILTDVTVEIKREEEARRENEKWDIIRKVIANRQAFGSFDREAKKLFAALAGRVVSWDSLLPDLHTLKGNAGFLGFRKTQEAAHLLEEYISANTALGEETNPGGQIGDLKNSFAEEVAVLTDSLGVTWRMDIDAIEIPKSEYLHIEDHIKNNCPNPALLTALEEHRKKPVQELFARFPGMAGQIAERLGKRVARIKVIGDSAKVIPDDFEELFDSFTHIIRNLVDHGIEPPIERESKGKPAAGSIGIEIADAPGEITFKFSDDGRGIQFDKVRERATQLGFINGRKNISQSELLSFIFRENFSTAPAASEISGRGVGLAAVRAAVMKMGGRIKVKTWNDHGTIFIVTVPTNGAAAGVA